MISHIDDKYHAMIERLEQKLNALTRNTVFEKNIHSSLVPPTPPSSLKKQQR